MDVRKRKVFAHDGLLSQNHCKFAPTSHAGRDLHWNHSLVKQTLLGEKQFEMSNDTRA